MSQRRRLHNLAQRGGGGGEDRFEKKRDSLWAGFEGAKPPQTLGIVTGIKTFLTCDYSPE